MPKALLILSQIGSVKHAKAALEFRKIDDVKVVVIWTEANPTARDEIELTVRKAGFNDIKLLQMHHRLNTLDKTVADDSEKRYAELLDKTTPNILFVCNYERHFALLLRQAAKRGISLHLFEEGAASYKGLHEDYQTFPLPPIKNQVRDAFRNTWKKTNLFKWVILPVYPLIRNSLLVFWDVLRIPYLAGLTVYRVIKSPFVQIKNFKHEDRVFLEGWKSFDVVYSCHVDLSKKIFESQKYEMVQAKYNEPEMILWSKSIIEKYGIDSRTAIFTAQHYNVTQRILTSKILDIIKRIAQQNDWRIVIKLHPRQKINARQIYSSAAEISENISVLSDDTPPAEYFAAYSRSPAVIAISSSTLIYSQKARPDIRCISIGYELLDQISHIDEPGVELIRQHMKLLQPMPHIEHSRCSNISLTSWETRSNEKDSNSHRK